MLEDEAKDDCTEDASIDSIEELVIDLHKLKPFLFAVPYIYIYPQHLQLKRSQ